MEKPKKERTEAQKKATASMLAKLKENREKGVSKPGRKKKEVKNVVEVEVPESDSESEVETPKQKVVIKEVVKEVPVEPKYITKEDLHAFRNELASMIHPPAPVVQEKQVRKPKKLVPVKEYEQEEEEEEPVYKPVYKPVKKQPVSQPSVLTGYSLLDKLLNR